MRPCLELYPLHPLYIPIAPSFENPNLINEILRYRFFSDQTIFFLLVKRSPLDWSDSTYSTYTMLKTFMMSLGMILLPLTLGRTKWILGKDSILIIVATSAGAVASMIPAFSQSTNAILFGSK